MNISQQLLEKIEKDYMQSGCIDWVAFKAGYLASLKRFGGNGFLPRNPKSAYYKDCNNGPQTHRK